MFVGVNGLCEIGDWCVVIVVVVVEVGKDDIVLIVGKGYE